MVQQHDSETGASEKVVNSGLGQLGPDHRGLEEWLTHQRHRLGELRFESAARYYVPNRQYFYKARCVVAGRSNVSYLG